ncbi:MAG: hypothetical protein CSA26_11155 [Desulfobacterales bacterium]|nr:MAG: hypothetical protein CSA26_11155 [Desulfobacterales bacterium]
MQKIVWKYFFRFGLVFYTWTARLLKEVTPFKSIASVGMRLKKAPAHPAGAKKKKCNYTHRLPIFKRSRLSKYGQPESSYKFEVSKTKALHTGESLLNK